MTSDRSRRRTRFCKSEAFTADGHLEVWSVLGTVLSLVGYVLQIIGLREMPWPALVAHLGSVLLMAVIRAWVQRHLGQGIGHYDLTPGAELDWLAMSLSAVGTAEPGQGDTHTDDVLRRAWMFNTGRNDGLRREESSQTFSRPMVHRVDNLSCPASTILLRQHLDYFSVPRRRPPCDLARTLERALVMAMDFFLPQLTKKSEYKHMSYSWPVGAWTRFDTGSGMWQSQAESLSEDESIRFQVNLLPYGWVADINHIAAALSISLHL